MKLLDKKSLALVTTGVLLCKAALPHSHRRRRFLSFPSWIR